MTYPGPDVDVETALRLVEVWAPGDTRARDMAASVLQQLPPTTKLLLAPAEVRALINIHRRRISRASDVVGAADLLQALEGCEEDEVLATAASADGVQVVLWLDLELSGVLGCVVGPDHRVDTPGEP